MKIKYLFQSIKKKNLEIDTFRKKIPISGMNKNKLKINVNNNKKRFHKKTMSFNREISGLISLRPKSTKQFNPNKNVEKNINFKIDKNIN